MAVEPGAAQSSSSGSTDTRVVSSGSRGMVWCGVCVVGQRMPRCCLSQVVYVRAVARVHALRGVVGWVGSSGGSGGVSAAPAGIHWPVECPLGGWSWGSAGVAAVRIPTLMCTHRRAHGGGARDLLPIPISLVIPPSLCPCRTLRVAFMFGVGCGGGAWRTSWWQVPEARAHIPSQTCR